MCKYIVSLVLASVVSTVGFGQKEKKLDPSDALLFKYLPTGLRIGTDALAIFKSQTDPTVKLWEVNADLDFNRYYLTADYGSWGKQITIDNGTKINNGDYQNNGKYFRIGVDINFLLKDPDKNMFFMGFRIGKSTFDHTLNYSMDYTGPYATGPIAKTVSASGVTASWGELTTGLRVKIVSGFWMGCTARLKFSPSYNNSPNLVPYDIPGYGLYEQTTYWGFNYQMFWRFPVRKVKARPKEVESKR
jgi:hypothetical protein